MAATVRDAPAAIDIAAGIKGFILWIGGSLAGITAVLYACGYLVTRAHMNMLGLYGFVEFDNDHFLQEGAKFLIVAGYDPAVMAMVFFTIVGLLAGVVVIGSYIISHRFDSAQQLGKWCRDHFDMDPAKAPRRIFYAGLFAVLVWHAGKYLDYFYAPLCISNLLYNDVETISCRSAGLISLAVPLRDALVGGASDKLHLAFDELFYAAMVQVLLACLAWYTVMSWRWRAWLIGPFLVSMGLFLMLLPMDYGVLKRPTRYPIVVLTPDKGMASWMSGRLFLINKTGPEFIVWDAAAHKLLWIPTNTVSRAEIIQVTDLFAASTNGARTKGGRK